MLVVISGSHKDPFAQAVLKTIPGSLALPYNSKTQLEVGFDQSDYILNMIGEDCPYKTGDAFVVDILDLVEATSQIHKLSPTVENMIKVLKQSFYTYVHGPDKLNKLFTKTF